MSAAAAMVRDPRDAIRRVENAARRMRFWARCYVRPDCVDDLESELAEEERLLRAELAAIAALLP